MAPLRRTRLAAAVAAILLSVFSSSDALDALDPTGTIDIKWDVMQWTPDGYVALVSMYNNQMFRHIESPGWTLGWRWAKKEIIWAMVGAQATMEGDCSLFPARPHSCKRDPEIVDLLPGVPYNSQVGNCCRGGVLSSRLQDPANSVSTFQISVGNTGNSNTTIFPPVDFNLRAPGPGYTCGSARKVPETLFPSADGRRNTQAFVTWNVSCSFTQNLAGRAPTCCVSYSAFYNDTIVPCPTCTCACQSNVTSPNGAPTCVEPTDKMAISAALRSGKPTQGLYCTNDMCPIKIHWHVKTNYVEYWRVKITVNNRNLFRNYSGWNVVVQHPNFDNFTEAFSFKYDGIAPYGDINDTAVFSGIKYFNEMLMSAGPNGNVQSEILFRKDDRFTFKRGWAFPRRLYFNGMACVLPDPEDYPRLPSKAVQLGDGHSRSLTLFSALVIVAVATFL